MTNNDDMVIGYCKSFPGSELQFHKVSYEVSMPNNFFKVITAMNIPDKGIRTAFLTNLDDFGFRAMIVMGSRGGFNLATVISTIGAYVAINVNRIYEGMLIDDALSDDGCGPFNHIVMTHPFPWLDLEDLCRARDISVFYALPISDVEIKTLKSYGYSKFQDLAVKLRSDVFNLSVAE